MKDPDVLDDALSEAQYEIVKDLMGNLGLSEFGAQAEAEFRLGKMREFANRFFEYREVLTVELDDVAKTITVLEKN
jgi:hypothetical protein